MSALVSLEHAHARLGPHGALAGVSFQIHPGEMVGLVGPNGAGKTTALRAMLGLLTLEAGQARLGGSPVASLDPIARARAVSYLPQARPLAWDMAVADIVALGRFAYGARPSRLSPRDHQAVEAALMAAGVAGFRDRRARSLSGGELARVHLARTLASDAPLVLADEPVAALDPRHQLLILEALKDRSARCGGGVGVVLHDLSLAARFCDRVLVFAHGQVLADGAPGTALCPDVLAAAFGVETGPGSAAFSPIEVRRVL
jgi:iron complex transport system ATP-binding protein